MGKMLFREASAEDFVAFFKVPVSHSFLGIVGVRDGYIEVFGGAFFNHVWGAFITVAEGVELTPREYVRGCNKAMGCLQTRVKALYAEAADTEYSDGFLRHFGFVPVRGRLYRWN